MNRAAGYSFVGIRFGVDLALPQAVKHIDCHCDTDLGRGMVGERSDMYLSLINNSN